MQRLIHSRRTVAPGKTLNGLQRSAFGLFGSTWWPCASFDRLRIVTYLAVWLFVWDDGKKLRVHALCAIS